MTVVDAVDGSYTDLAKHVFQVHGVDATGKVIIRKKLRRSELKVFFEKLPRCLIGVEACGTARYWRAVSWQRSAMMYG